MNEYYATQQLVKSALESSVSRSDKNAKKIQDKGFLEDDLYICTHK